MAPEVLPAQSCLISVVTTNCRAILPEHPYCWCRDVQKGHPEHSWVMGTRRLPGEKCATSAGLQWPQHTESRAQRSLGRVLTTAGQAVRASCLLEGSGWVGEHAKDGLERHFRGRTERLPFQCMKEERIWKWLWGTLVCCREPLKTPQNQSDMKTLIMGEGHGKNLMHCLPLGI